MTTSIYFNYTYEHAETINNQIGLVILFDKKPQQFFIVHLKYCWALRNESPYARRILDAYAYWTSQTDFRFAEQNALTSTKCLQFR